jgi:hypothetical protein
LAGGTLLSLLLLAFLAVQIQQRMLRWHAERLLAEVHQIRLYQSTWADAQQLMRRWGAWGHYEGSCTAESCTYEIRLANISYYNPRARRHAWLDWLLTHDRLNLYSWFGGRGSAFHASFTVHDGTIWREFTGIGVTVPSRRIRGDDDFDRSLSMGAGSYQRLHRTQETWTFMGSEDELAQHPFYKVGRPGGCMINCEIGEVYYSTRTPPAEIERLTSYDFSCFTRFHPCAELEDLLPAAKEWHLYKEDEIRSSLPEKPCDVPVWALARDARYVLTVEALSIKTVKEREPDREMASVRVLSSLKEAAPWLPGAIVSAYPNLRSTQATEHLLPGRRYVVFPVGNDRRDERVTRDSPLRLDRCGVQQDTPETRRELEKGFAQNDSLNP